MTEKLTEVAQIKCSNGSIVEAFIMNETHYGVLFEKPARAKDRSKAREHPIPIFKDGKVFHPIKLTHEAAKALVICLAAVIEKHENNQT
jgi:hypothetical protein